MSSARGVGLVLRDPLPWEELRETAQTAEEAGYAAILVPEIAGREAFSTLSGLAAATTTIALGTGVVPMDSRRPDVTAMAAATVQDLSEGRHVLGLGAGHPPAGVRPGPLERLREYVLAVRSALHGGPASAPAFGLGSFIPELTPDPPPPIWVAALGDRMVELAAELADGVLLNWCTAERVRRAKATISEAARRAGRDAAAITIAVYVRACVGPPAGVSLAALQEMTGRYASLPNYLRQFERMGLGERARAAAAAFARGRPEEVPQDLVDGLCVRGSRDAWIRRAAAFRAAGADLVLCYPVAAMDPFSSVLGTALACAPDPSVER